MAILLSPAFLGGAVLQVGPGQLYATPCAAIAAAAPGDTILIDAAGSYNGDVCMWYTNGLTLRGVNGRPHIDAAGKNADGKGIWVIDGDNTVVENMELSGATVPDGNGAAIRSESNNLTIRNCYIHNNQDGLLTGNPGPGDILIEYSEFAYNGTGTGFTHNIYIGQQGTFTMRFSYSHHAYSGQLVKTRAAENHILYNRLTTESGNTSYEIDIPNGGLSYVIGNLVQQGMNGQNSNIMDYMIEGTDPHNPDHRVFVSNNTFVNDMNYGQFILMSPTNTTPAVVQNNIFYGPGTIINQSSAILQNNLSNVDPLFVNEAALDYHLRSGSPAINAGIDPGLGAGQSLNPDYDYLHATCGEARIAAGSIDIGAYEFGSLGLSLACTTAVGPVMINLAVSPSTVISGANSSATVTFDNPAPITGMVVIMTSSNAAAASTASSIPIEAEALGASFPVTTGVVSSPTEVTLTASYGGISKTAILTVNPPALSPDFSIAVLPVSQSVVQGGTTSNYTVSVTPANGFSGTVAFTVNGLPAGASTSPNPPTASTTSTSFTVTTLASLAPGTYPFTITGTNASLTHTINATLVVTPAPNFSIAVLPASQSVVQGGTTGNYTASVTPANGFTGSVGFAVNGLPAGASTNPNPPTASTTSTSFTITTLASLAPGTYPFTITGTNASLTHTINATLVVTATPDFSIAVLPASQSVVLGGTTGNYAISVTPANGFSGTVAFTVSGLPVGASTNPNPPTSSTTSSGFTITTLASLAPGTYPFTITGTNASLTHTINASLTVTPVVVAGSLLGSATTTAAAANLTTEGTSDWLHWGDASLTRKAGVAAQLSNYTVVGGGSVQTYANDPRPLNWTDGTPTASSANNLKGIYINGTGNGFSITAPADTSSRTVVVHVGGWNSAGLLTAHLSDNSAPDFTNTTAAAGGQYDRNYTFTYQAGAPGQNLTVTWKMASGSGNVTLNGAAVASAAVAATSITSTGGTPQSAPVGTAFVSSLKATVKDANNNPMNGAAVTFTAPGSGASGTFISSGTATVTVNTDVNGVATAPTFTANTTAGSYSVAASAPGATATASFSLTNQPGAPSSVTATSGTPQTAAANTTFGALLVATVKDSSGNPVSGAPVTFTAPSSGAGGTFGAPGGAAVLAATVNTDSNGVATAPAFTANSAGGSYTVVASVPGAASSASFSLTNQVAAASSVTATGGTPQSVKIGTAFPTVLSAIVKDSGGNPVNGVPVTFTAPASGASGTFSGSATVNSNGSGVATAPAFTANTVVGSYTVVASAPGAATSAGFSLTNQVGSPASVTATGGTPQSAAVNSAFATLLVATVKDAGGNPVSGITVTFTAPAAGANGSFNGGSASASVVTIGNGTATAPAFTANGTAGAYTVTASVSGVSASASFGLTNNPIAAAGSLSGIGDSVKTGAVLSSEGASDWVHWGDASLNRKAGVTALIGNATVVGRVNVQQYSNDPRPLSWTGGTPTANSTNNLTGLYVSGFGSGFSITAPAGTMSRTFVLHVGGWNSGGTLTAHLSDGSAVDFVDTTVTVGGQYDRNYTLTYHAATAAQTLTVTWRMASGSGNVTLNGAALR